MKQEPKVQALGILFLLGEEDVNDMGRIVFTEKKPSCCPIRKLKFVDCKRMLTLEAKEDFKSFKGFTKKLSRRPPLRGDPLLSEQLYSSSIAERVALQGLFDMWVKNPANI